MYTRAVRGLFIVTGHSLSKPKCSTQAFHGGIKLFPNCLSKNHSSNFINFRYCTTFSPLHKDELGEEKLNEFIKDPVNEKQYKVLQLEVDVMRQSGENIPSSIKPRYWFELLQLNSRAKRKKYLTFLFGIEMKKEHQQEKKRIRAEEKPKNIDDDTPLHLQYRLGKNSYFLRFYDSTMNHHYNWKLLRAMMNGQKLVIDCGFEDKMTRHELKNCARQLQLAFAANRAHDDPYDLHYCNFNTNGYLHQEFYSYIPTMYDPIFPINIHEKSYLELFDKDKLIYLTPDCKQEIEKFDHEAIYIIGGIVDKVSGMPLSMAKAKREGIRMAKLPIDRYLNFGHGSGKSLTLNQMVDILADIRLTGDWNHSLRHVPKRKLFANRQYQTERRMEKLLKDNSEKKIIISTNPADFSMGARNKFRNKL